MSKTVTIPLDEFDKLRKGFDESISKINLEAQIKELKEQVNHYENKLEDILKSDFVRIETPRIFYLTKNVRIYISKDKTPKWIREFFN